MKKILTFLFVFVAAVTLSFGQSVGSMTDEEPANAAKIVKWDTNRHDFGKIPEGNPVSTTYMMTNISNEPVLIDNVRTTCGCTAPTWSRDPILPGQSSPIDISFNAKKTGQFNKVIKVFLKGQKESEVLIIQGEVLPGQNTGEGQ